MHNALRRPLLRSFRNGARSGGSPASGATLRAGVELLLVALLALQAARLGWLLLAPAGPLVADDSVVAAPAPVPPALALSSDPFHPAAGRHGVAAADVSGLRLHGVRMAGTGSSAILSSADAPQAAFRTGDSVAPGVVLHAVASDHVILRTGAGERRLALEAAPASTATAVAPTRTVGTTAGPSTAPIDPAALVAQAGFSARVENGKITGYTLIPRGDGAVLRQAGLEAGDVLLALNGNPLTPERIAELEPELARGEARLTVQRGGQTRTLTLRTALP